MLLILSGYLKLSVLGKALRFKYLVWILLLVCASILFGQF